MDVSFFLSLAGFIFLWCVTDSVSTMKIHRAEQIHGQLALNRDVLAHHTHTAH